MPIGYFVNTIYSFYEYQTNKWLNILYSYKRGSPWAKYYLYVQINTLVKEENESNQMAKIYFYLFDINLQKKLIEDQQN